MSKKSSPTEVLFPNRVWEKSLSQVNHHLSDFYVELERAAFEVIARNRRTKVHVNVEGFAGGEGVGPAGSHQGNPDYWVNRRSTEGGTALLATQVFTASASRLAHSPSMRW
jgi:hypothetical protein